MYRKLLRSESMKLRKSKIWILAFISPVLSTFTGYMVDYDFGLNAWINPLFVMINIHAILFLPLLTGVLSAFVCRYEHQSGGWKQLVTLPVSRVKVYAAKGTVVALFLAFTQILFLVGWLFLGWIKGATDPFPIDIALTSIIGGWLACLPLAALQLWVSTAWASFAAPLALNVIFTLPNILVMNSETYGPLYPWVQPALTMLPTNTAAEFFYVSNETLVFVIGGSFLVFLLGGMTYFSRKII